MTPNRKETNGQMGQPIRFYKYVALTFLIMTVVLLGVIVFMSSKRADITVITRADSIEVRENMLIGDDIEGEVEISEIELIESYSPSQAKEEKSVAVGMVILYNETNYNQPLVATTRLLSPDDILFRLKERVTVPANDSVEVEVYADQSGPESEIGPTSFTIPGLRAETQAVIYAKSLEPMKGGVRRVGFLSQSDWDRAEIQMHDKLLEFGKNKFTLPENMSVVFGLSDFEISSQNEIGDELEEFEISAQAKIAAIFYEEDKVREVLRRELNKHLIGEDELLSSGEEEMSITLVDFDLEEEKFELEVFCNGLVSLSPESQQLEKQMFFGKNKDEVRRYLLSLDHVQGAEIKFSPLWMRTVPYVAEHVSVMVKNVE